MKSFGKEETGVIKGVAVLLMLIHHLFYQEEYLQNCIFLLPFEKEGILQFAQTSKVCVAMFLLLSGFGLYKSWQSRGGDTSWRDGFLFSARYIKKLLIQYWWAVIPLAVFGVLTGLRSPSEVYGPFLSDKWKLVTDLLGINYILFGCTNLFNVTCWYLGAAILLYLLFPILCRLLQMSPFLFCAVVLLVGLYNGKLLLPPEPIWLLPFALGILLAHRGILDAVCARLHRPVWSDVLGILLFLAAAAQIQNHHPFVCDGLLAFAIICTVLALVRVAKPVRTVLSFLGKHSANIFMTHTFFYLYYFPRFFCAFRFPSLILLSLLAVCVFYSAALETVKKHVHTIAGVWGR